MTINNTEELINDIRFGKMVILVDDEDRENEGDIIIAAECVKPRDINFMAKNARGLICLTLTGEHCDQLQLPLMVSDNQCIHNTNFTMSIEAAEGVTTGISAADRAYTIRTAIAKNASPNDIVQPGHIFPLRSQKGGVLTRAGHTEAGCDLARLAGFKPASVIVEIMNDNGTMARRKALEIFAKNHKIKIGTIANLIHYRVLHEKTINFIDDGEIETEFGKFKMKRYRDSLYGNIHFILIMGKINSNEPTLARVHISNIVRDVIHADVPGITGWNMKRTMKYISKNGKGVIVLLGNHENDDLFFSSDLVLKKRTLPQITQNENTEMNLSVGLGSQLLREAGIGKMRLLSNPIRYNAISGFNLEIIEFISYNKISNEKKYENN